MTGMAARLRIVRELTRRLKAVETGHHDVHQDQVRVQLARLAYRLGAVGGGGGAESVLLEGLLHHVNLGR